MKQDRHDQAIALTSALTTMDKQVVHDVLVVNEGLGGDEVVFSVVRQLEVEADVGGPFGWNLGVGEPQCDVQYTCNHDSLAVLVVFTFLYKHFVVVIVL